MINDERPKSKIKALLRGRVCFESIAESSQSHGIDPPADSDAYRQSEASTERNGGGNTDTGIFLYLRLAHDSDP